MVTIPSRSTSGQDSKSLCLCEQRERVAVSKVHWWKWDGRFHTQQMPALVTHSDRWRTLIGSGHHHRVRWSHGEWENEGATWEYKENRGNIQELLKPNKYALVYWSQLYFFKQKHLCSFLDFSQSCEACFHRFHLGLESLQPRGVSRRLRGLIIAADKQHARLGGAEAYSPLVF